MAENPRFTDEAIEELTFPDKDKIPCTHCHWRAEDRPAFHFSGACLGVCQIYSVKPYGIIWGGDECPYFLSDSEYSNEE